jgi:thiamine-monophosphate kinase
MTSEFSLIARYFSRPTPHATLGIGDDAALLPVSPGAELAISTDTLVAGRHFFADADPYGVGWKTLAVNLSDLAAMGAKPRWALLAITLPNADEAWLEAFSNGLYACAQAYHTELIGGDTTGGPLTCTVTILGEVPPEQALRRDRAQAGDDIWVSGWLGEAALGLTALQGKVELPADALAICRAALERPAPRVELGLALRGVARAAVDISDGLLADLGHILERSQLGAEIHFDALPAHPTLVHFLHQEWARRCLLAGGDDYELCFTAAASRRGEIEAIGHRLGLPLTHIGNITTNTNLRLLDGNGQLMTTTKGGYDHFA